MAEKKIERYKQFIPSVFKPGINPVITALLESWAQSDDTIVTQIQETKAQLFVRTADGQFLDRLGSGVAVDRPSELGMLDEDFQKLIPNLSFKAKQVRKIFYETMDIFWGPLFSRINVQSANSAPFNVSSGDEILIKVDGTAEQSRVAKATDIAIAGAATAQEMIDILNNLTDITASIIEDQITGDEFVNIRTNTPGNRGSLQINSTSSMISALKLDFTAVVDKKVRITDLSQRTVIYEVRDRELIIELPVTVPTLRRTLLGSHHFHADATLEPAVPPENGIWQGSFLFSPTGELYTVTSQSVISEETVTAGTVITQLTVDDASNIPDSTGFLIFNWGLTNEEQPVKYFGRPNDKTLLIDPAHLFAETHAIGNIRRIIYC